MSSPNPASILDVFCYFFFKRSSIALKEFISNMSWSLLGGIVAAGILLVTNILAGRILGAEEYGKYSIIFTVAQICIVLFLFGMDLSVARSLAIYTEKNDRKNYISTAFITVLLTIFISLFVVSFFSKQVGHLFHIEKKLFLFAIFFGAILAIRQFLDSAIRGVSRFRLQALLRILESFGVLGFFCLSVFFFKERSFLAYVSSIIFGGSFLCVAYIFSLKNFFFTWSNETFRALLNYGKIAFLATLFGIVFGSLDKIAIAHYLSLSDLGVYSAYYTASFLVVTQIGALFDNVFFPMVARYKDNLTPIIQKVDYFSLTLFLPFFISMCGIVYVLLCLFGKGFPIIWAYIFGFSFIATLKCILIVNTSLITAHSKASLKLGLIYGNSINVVFIFIFLIFIQMFELSLLSMVYFLITYTGVFIVLNKWILYKVGFYRKHYA